MVRERELQFSSVQFSLSVVSDSLQPYESQQTRPPCPSPTPMSLGVNPCPLIDDTVQTPHPLTSPSRPALNLSQYQDVFKCQLFTSGGQIIGVSASISVFPMNTKDWFPLGWTGWIPSSPRDSQESS